MSPTPEYGRAVAATEAVIAQLSTSRLKVATVIAKSGKVPTVSIATTEARTEAKTGDDHVTTGTTGTTVFIKIAVPSHGATRIG